MIGSLLLDRGFLPSEAGRLVSIFVASDDASIFDAGNLSSDTGLFFIIAAIFANSGLTLVVPPTLFLSPGPLPPGGCCGAGSIIPAGTGGGPAGCTKSGSGWTLAGDLPRAPSFVGIFAGILPTAFLIAFPPP